MRKIRQAIVLAAAICLGGCGTTIPPEKYKDYAFILSGVPDGSYPCTPGNSISCAFIGYVDGKVQMPASPRFVLEPGVHTIGLGRSPGGYTFNAEGGHRYILLNSRILVSMKDQPESNTIEELVPFDGKFIPAQSAQRTSAQRDAQKANAFAARQVIDMPRIRKVGAEICHATKYFETDAHGFVEAITDNKIKISVDSGVESGKTIWDFPDQWYLCGRN
jgi:hypothetical protein